jgi:hypothetical protein
MSDVDLAITNFTRARLTHDGVNRAPDMIIHHHDLKLKFRQELDGVMAGRDVSGAPSPVRDFYLGYGNTFYSHLDQGRTNILHLERSDNRLDFLHDPDQFAGQVWQMQVAGAVAALSREGGQTGICPESDKAKRAAGRHTLPIALP